MKITQQTETAQQDLPCSEYTVRRMHGKEEGSRCGAQAEQHVPEGILAVPPDRAQQIIKQTERHAQRKGKTKGESLRTQIDAHSAEKPRPEAALTRRFLVA